jgi:hypothetical protein
MWKEAAVTYFAVIIPYLTGRTETSTKRPQTPSSGRGLNPTPSEHKAVCSSVGAPRHSYAHNINIYIYIINYFVTVTVAFKWLTQGAETSLVRTLRNLRVSQTVGNFLTGWVTINFQRMFLLAGVLWLQATETKKTSLVPHCCLLLNI